MRLRDGLAALAAAATLIGAPAEGRPLLREDDPSLTLALAADADGDGSVTKAEIADAAARAVTGAEAEFSEDWRRKLLVYGMSPQATVLDVKAIYAATLRLLDAADADRDGAVTALEMRNHVQAFPADLRGDMISTAFALDRDANGTVSKDERDRAEAAFAKEMARMEALPPAERDAALHPTRAKALETWKESTERVALAAVDLWRGVAGPDGKAGTGDLRDAAAQ